MTGGGGHAASSGSRHGRTHSAPVPPSDDAGVRHHGDDRPGVADEHLLSDHVQRRRGRRDRPAAGHALASRSTPKSRRSSPCLPGRDANSVVVYLGDGKEGQAR